MSSIEPIKSGYRVTTYLFSKQTDKFLWLISTLNGRVLRFCLSDKNDSSPSDYGGDLLEFLWADSTTRQIAIDNQILVSRDTDEQALAIDIFGQARSFRSRVRQSFSLHIFLTHDCNFRCTYCIQGHSIKREKKSRMTVDQIDHGFELIDKLSSEKQIFCNRVNLFGGEPLLPLNLQTVRRAIMRATERGFGTQISTNGTYFSYFRNAVGQDWQDADLTFLVSLDGLRETHNKRRVAFNGQDYFDKIVDSIGLMLGDGHRVILQPIVDNTNIEGIEALIKFAESQGWTQSRTFRISAGITMFPDGGVGTAKGMRSYEPLVIGKLLELQLIYPCFELGFDSLLKASAFIDTTLRRRQSFPIVTGCDAVLGRSFSIAPDGLIYPCREVAGSDPSKAVGRFYPEFELFESCESSVGSAVACDRADCHRCRFILLCGGGCPVARDTHDGKTGGCPPFLESWSSYLESYERLEIDDENVTH
jgi:uncharacterized protein